METVQKMLNISEFSVEALRKNPELIFSYIAFLEKEEIENRKIGEISNVNLKKTFYSYESNPYSQDFYGIRDRVLCTSAKHILSVYEKLKENDGFISRPENVGCLKLFDIEFHPFYCPIVSMKNQIEDLGKRKMDEELKKEKLSILKMLKSSGKYVGVCNPGIEIIEYFNIDEFNLTGSA